MSQKVGWIIDDEMFPDYCHELISAIQEQGHIAKVIHAPSPPFRWDDIGCSYRETFSSDSCVVIHADIELATRVRNERRWIPGAFCTINNFLFSNYACHFGEYLLNRDYVMLPFGELRRQKEFIFKTFGHEGRIFVRPDSPLKIFSGQLATYDTFDSDVDFMGFYDFPKSSLVVCSTPKRLLREWRFVVARGEVVTGCLYKDESRSESLAFVDPKAMELAKSVAQVGYEPDPVWVMDICQTANGSCYLLEIGGFSFSNLYACSMQRVVSAVSSVALEIWNRSKA